MQFKAEVSGRLGGEKSCQGLLYAPLDAHLTYRSSQFYAIDFEGDELALTDFVEKVLVDDVSQTFQLEGKPVFNGHAFCLEYGMKPTALDLEKESILAYHRGSASDAFKILGLNIYKRLYIFSKEGEEASPDLFIRDIVNPAIHVWRVFTDARPTD